MKILPVKTIVLSVICFSIFVPVAAKECSAGQGEFNESAFKEGMEYYGKNENDKALDFFKKALTGTFVSPESQEIESAINLIKAGKMDEAEKKLLMLFESNTDSARARYELGLIYEKQGKTDEAATLLHNSLEILSSQGARYVGVKKCKRCHLKEYKSWKKTKMAKTFDVLKPEVMVEVKVKLKFDPQKDYTKDPKCLPCHATGFGLPGGYKIPKDDDPKSKIQAKENEGTTCEACHGPGGRYIDIHDDIKNKKRNYTAQELYDAGGYKIEANICTKCHNHRNPTVTANYRFDFERSKSQDAHENYPLKYRVK